MNKFIEIHNLLLWMIFVESNINMLWSFAASQKSYYLISNISHCVSSHVLLIFSMIMCYIFMDSFVSSIRTWAILGIWLILIFKKWLSKNTLWFNYLLSVLNKVLFSVLDLLIVNIVFVNISLRKIKILRNKINLLWRYQNLVCKKVWIINSWLWEVEVKRNVRKSCNW